MIELLTSPLHQLAIYGAALIVIAVAGRLEAEHLFYYGTMLHLLWMLVAGSYGIRTSITWYYYLQLCGAYAAGYILLVIAIWIADTYGTSYNGEGAIVLLAPVFAGGTILVFQLLLKAVWRLIA